MVIDWSFFFNIAGLLLGIVSILMSIDYFKKRKYPGSITFIKASNLNLVSDLAQNYAGMQVMLKGQPLDSPVSYYKGVLVNSGHIDLAAGTVAIEFPSGTRVLNASVLQQSSGIGTIVRNREDAKLQLDFDLFRIREFIEFEVLLENAPSTIIPLFHHRIPDTSPVRFMNESPSVRLIASRVMLYISVVSFVTLFIISALIFQLGTCTSELYVKNSNTGELYSFFMSGDDVQLLGKDSRKEILINPKDSVALAQLRLQPVSLAPVQNKEFENFATYTLVSLAVIGLLIGFRTHQLKRVRRILEVWPVHTA